VCCVRVYARALVPPNIYTYIHTQAPINKPQAAKLPAVGWGHTCTLIMYRCNLHDAPPTRLTNNKQRTAIIAAQAHAIQYTLLHLYRYRYI